MWSKTLDSLNPINCIFFCSSVGTLIARLFLCRHKAVENKKKPVHQVQLGGGGGGGGGGYALEVRTRLLSWQNSDSCWSLTLVWSNRVGFIHTKLRTLCPMGPSLMTCKS